MVLIIIIMRPNHRILIPPASVKALDNQYLTHPFICESMYEHLHTNCTK